MLIVKEIPFQFVYHNEKHFFGNKKTWIDSFNRVQCSDLEKTIIDCLFKPDYASGITEITKAIFKIRNKIDYPKLFLEKVLNKETAFKRDWQKKLSSQIHDITEYERVFREARRHLKF